MDRDRRLNLARTLVIGWLSIICLQHSMSDALMDTDCGRKEPLRQRRIVGGVRSETCEFPWMVVVFVEDAQCGGSIIDNRHVLTAAHCLEGTRTPDPFVYVMGGSNRVDNMTVLEVETWERHPFRYSQSFDFDVAVLTLVEEIEFNRCLSPICLPTLESRPKDNDKCLAAGWGVDVNDEVTTHQMKISLPLVNSRTCKQIYNQEFDGTKFCAGDLFHGGKDTCQGDSGGPLMCGSADDGFVQYGIVSFGRGCALPFHPGVYTRVNHRLILNFILGVVQGDKANGAV